MKWLRLVSSMALAGQLAIGAASAERDKTIPEADESGTRAATVPAVSRPSEPADSMVLTLPGLAAPRPVVSLPPDPVSAAPVAPPVIPPLSAARGPAPIKVPVRAPVAAIRREPPQSPMEAESRPSPNGVKLALPADFVKESAVFCQKQISQWKEADARAVFGAPLRQRPAYGEDKKTANGRIYAFSDPTGRYKELELDFDKSGGTLRTVFVYPPRMTWEECRRLWGANVTSADARQGRTFYSYLNRRLDVLVDQQGQVISLGLY
jgi:hypothetical protein